MPHRDGPLLLWSAIFIAFLSRKRRPSSRRTEVRVLLALLGRQPLLVVVPEQLVQKVDGLIGDVPLVLGRDEARPRLARVPAEQVVELRVELDVVPLQTG